MGGMAHKGLLCGEARDQPLPEPTECLSSHVTCQLLLQTGHRRPDTINLPL